MLRRQTKELFHCRTTLSLPHSQLLLFGYPLRSMRPYLHVSNLHRRRRHLLAVINEFLSLARYDNGSTKLCSNATNAAWWCVPVFS